MFVYLTIEKEITSMNFKIKKFICLIIRHSLFSLSISYSSQTQSFLAPPTPIIFRKINLGDPLNQFPAIEREISETVATINYPYFYHTKYRHVLKHYSHTTKGLYNFEKQSKSHRRKALKQRKYNFLILF